MIIFVFTLLQVILVCGCVCDCVWFRARACACACVCPRTYWLTETRCTYVHICTAYTGPMLYIMHTLCIIT